MATNYDPQYPDAQRRTVYQEGLQYQDWVVYQLQQKLGLVLQPLTSRRGQMEMGESFQGWEIKLDRLCTQTGRLSIEVAEKSRADMPYWVPSGIRRSDNSWLYIQGNERQLWVFSKRWLLDFYHGQKPEIHELPTVRKFYLPLRVANDHALKTLVFAPEEQMVFREGNHEWGRKTPGIPRLP